MNAFNGAMMCGIAMMGVVGVSQAGERAGSQSSLLVQDARVVLAALTAAATENREAGREARLRGDALMAFYIRRAADATAPLPAERAGPALLIGLAIGLDSQPTLVDNLLFRHRLAGVESPAERQQRVSLLGCPTVRGRRDLAKHVVVSMGLVALAGPEAAEAIGVAKELNDARDGSGFSFADYAANLAGIELARRVLAGALPMARLAREFAVPDYVPEMDALPEGLSLDRFQSEYGATTDARFQAMRSLILERIAALPGYR